MHFLTYSEDYRLNGEASNKHTDYPMNLDVFNDGFKVRKKKFFKETYSGMRCFTAFDACFSLETCSMPWISRISRSQTISIIWETTDRFN